MPNHPLRKYVPFMWGSSIDEADIAPDTILAADIADGAVGTGELADGALSADAAGRLKTATGYFDLATVADKFADGSVATAQLAAGILSAAVLGRALMAAGFFDAATVLDKFAANSFDAPNVADAFATNSIDVANFADIVADLAVITAKLANNAVTPAKVEIDLIQYVDVQLTNAQVLALSATPITLVAAPAADRAILVHAIHAVANSAGGAYTEAAGQDMVVEYASGADIQTLDNTGFVTTGDVQARYWRPDGSAIAGLTPVAASAVRLFKTVGEFGGGNAANTLSVRVYYSVVDTIAFT